MENDNFEKLLRALSHRKPFRSYTVEFVNGEKIEVDHPEALIVRAGVAVYLSADGTPAWFESFGREPRCRSSAGIGSAYGISMIASSDFLIASAPGNSGFEMVCVAPPRYHVGDSASAIRVRHDSLWITGVAFICLVLSLYPDHLVNIWDVDGTDRQKVVLARWRAAYRRLGFLGRAVKLFWRRRTRSASYQSVSMKKHIKRLLQN